jgi:hypothetical protein
MTHQERDEAFFEEFPSVRSFVRAADDKEIADGWQWGPLRLIVCFDGRLWDVLCSTVMPHRNHDVVEQRMGSPIGVPAIPSPLVMVH